MLVRMIALLLTEEKLDIICFILIYKGWSNDLCNQYQELSRQILLFICSKVMIFCFGESWAKMNFSQTGFSEAS